MPAVREFRVLENDVTSPSPSESRIYRACSKCQQRKIKCDGAVPKCGPCTRSQLEDCDVSERVTYTLRHVQSLEQRIEWLEKMVAASYEDGGLIGSLPTGTTLLPRDAGLSRISEPVVEEVGVLSLRGSGSYVGSMSGVTLTRLIVSAIRINGEQLQDIAVDGLTTGPTNDFRTRAGYPSRDLAIRYVQSYIHRVHRWYPFLDLGTLSASLRAVYDTSSWMRLSGCAKMNLLMVFALGAGEQIEPFAPEDYFTAAHTFLPAALEFETLDTVRSLLLLCMYGLRSWNGPSKYSINVWLVVGHALRIGIGLGIMRNNYVFGEEENESRRKVWWSVYAVERYVATGLCRVMGIRNEGESCTSQHPIVNAIDAHLPRASHELLPPDLITFLGSETQTSIELQPAKLLYRQRSLLGDIQETIYVAIPRDGPPTLTVDEMAPHISSLQARLIRWTHDVYQSTQPDTIERDYLQLAFLQATLLLHRPSPSFPLPSAEALDLCLSAARQIIQIAASAISRHLVNDLIPGWAGFYTLFMSGLTLMYCSWADSSCPNAVVDIETDAEAKLCLSVLDTLSSSSPNATRYNALFRDIYDRLAKITSAARSNVTQIDYLQAVTADSGLVNLEGLELDQEALEYINQLLLETGR